MDCKWNVVQDGLIMRNSRIRVGTLTKLHSLSKPDGQAKLKISTNLLIRVISFVLLNSTHEIH